MLRSITAIVCFWNFIRVAYALSDQKIFDIIKHNPNLFYKYIKINYLALELKQSERAKLLADHYNFLRKRLSLPFISGLRSGMRLWENQAGHSIVIRYSDDPYHEGELTLGYKVAGEPVYWLGFSVVRAERFALAPAWVAFLTRIQIWGDLNRVKQVSRDADGVFPAYSLTAALDGIVGALDLGGIVGVDASRQASTRDRKYAAERTYDAFFESLGGARIGRGRFGRFFWFPPDRNDRPAFSPDSSHKARARRRRAFRETIRRSVEAAMRDLAEKPPAGSH